MSGVGLISVLSSLTTVAAQPISYLFVIPAIGSLVGMVVWLQAQGSLDRLGPTVLVTLCGVPVLLVYVGMLRFSAYVWSGILADFVPFVVFMLVLLVPQLETLRRVRRGLAPAVLAVLTLVMLAVVLRPWTWTPAPRESGGSISSRRSACSTRSCSIVKV